MKIISNSRWEYTKFTISSHISECDRVYAFDEFMNGILDEALSTNFSGWKFHIEFAQ